MAFVIFLYLIGALITYFVIKIAVKHAIKESLGDIRGTVKQAILGALYENEYRKGKNNN